MRVYECAHFTWPKNVRTLSELLRGDQACAVEGREGGAGRIERFAAVIRARRCMRPWQRGQLHSVGLARKGVSVGGAWWRRSRQSGSRWARLRLARKPK